MSSPDLDLMFSFLTMMTSHRARKECDKSSNSMTRFLKKKKKCIDKTRTILLQYNDISLSEGRDKTRQEATNAPKETAK